MMFNTTDSCDSVAIGRTKDLHTKSVLYHFCGVTVVAYWDIYRIFSWVYRKISMIAYDSTRVRILTMENHNFQWLR